MQSWCHLYQTGSVVGEGLYDLPTIRAPGEVEVLRCVNEHGQHLPCHDGCSLASYSSLDLRAEHHCPVHATQTQDATLCLLTQLCIVWCE